jgi:hypothetical protein
MYDGYDQVRLNDVLEVVGRQTLKWKKM